MKIVVNQCLSLTWQNGPIFTTLNCPSQSKVVLRVCFVLSPLLTNGPGECFQVGTNFGTTPARCVLAGVFCFFVSFFLFLCYTLKQNEAQSARAGSTHGVVKYRPKDVTQTQQRLESPTVTLIWHASKYKRHIIFVILMTFFFLYTYSFLTSFTSASSCLPSSLLLSSSFVIYLLAPEEDDFCWKRSCTIVSLCFVALVSTFPYICSISSLCTLYLLACQVRVTVGDSGLCCFLCSVLTVLLATVGIPSVMGE